MNAILLLSTAWMAGADPVPTPAPAPVAVTSGAGCGGGCGASSGCCDSGCHKASLLDRLRARFARSSSCGCEKATSCGCEHGPRCKPACGTPLWHGRNHECNSCNTCQDSCHKASFWDRLRARFGSRRHHGCCESAPTCCGAAPAGCSAPGAPIAPPTTPGGEAPKVMPKKTNLVIPSNLTPTSNQVPPTIEAPAFGTKSPF